MSEMKSELQPSILVIGGGTGSSTLLGEFRNLTPDITAIVNMSDDGGSTGILRREYSVSPPGDLRQCLVALSNNEAAADMFSYRFSDGSLRGHALGNVVISGLEKTLGDDIIAAVAEASKMLNITGRVIPVTSQKHTLVMEDGNNTITGEYSIVESYLHSRQRSVWHDPEASITAEAEDAISHADIITVAPGNLYGSIIPALAVKGLREAVRDAKAHTVMVSNLVNKRGQTDDWHVTDHVREVQAYLPDIETVLYNTKHPDSAMLKQYAAEGAYPVRTDEEGFKKLDVKQIGQDILSNVVFDQHENDTLLLRTKIRHDAKKVGAEIMKIFTATKANKSLL